MKNLIISFSLLLNSRLSLASFFHFSITSLNCCAPLFAITRSPSKISSSPLLRKMLSYAILKLQQTSSVSDSSSENSIYSGVGLILAPIPLSPNFSMRMSQQPSLSLRQLQILRVQPNLGWLLKRMTMTSRPMMVRTSELRKGLDLSGASMTVLSRSIMSYSYSWSWEMVVAMGQAYLQGKTDLTVEMFQQTECSFSLSRHLLTCSSCSGLLSSSLRFRLKPMCRSVSSLAILEQVWVMRLRQGYSSRFRKHSFSGVIFWKVMPLNLALLSIFLVVFSTSSSITFLKPFLISLSNSTSCPLVLSSTSFTRSSLWLFFLKPEALTCDSSPSSWWLMSQQAPIALSRYQRCWALLLLLMILIMSEQQESNLLRSGMGSGPARTFSKSLHMLQKRRGIFSSTNYLMTSVTWKLNCRKRTRRAQYVAGVAHIDSSIFEFLYYRARLRVRWAILVYCPQRVDWQCRKCYIRNQHFRQNTFFYRRHTYSNSQQCPQSQELYFLRLIPNYIHNIPFF